jgi:hypothetical protein
MKLHNDILHNDIDHKNIYHNDTLHVRKCVLLAVLIWFIMLRVNINILALASNLI